jgi:Rubisco LSMT substrate-binding
VQEFPIYEDRMPLPLLAYLRLARVSDAAQLAKVTFEEDVIITPANEYEVLQLLLGDCKERLSAYEGWPPGSCICHILVCMFALGRATWHGFVHGGSGVCKHAWGCGGLVSGV